VRISISQLSNPLFPKGEVFRASLPPLFAVRIILLNIPCTCGEILLPPSRTDLLPFQSGPYWRYKVAARPSNDVGGQYCQVGRGGKGQAFAATIPEFIWHSMSSEILPVGGKKHPRRELAINSDYSRSSPGHFPSAKTDGPCFPNHPLCDDGRRLSFPF